MGQVKACAKEESGTEAVSDWERRYVGRRSDHVRVLEHRRRSDVGAGPVGGFLAEFSGETANGSTITLGGVTIGPNSEMYNQTFAPYSITSGTMTINLSDSGILSGTLTLASSLATVNGTISGSYILTTL